jgi:hypothetical protein
MEFRQAAKPGTVLTAFAFGYQEDFGIDAASMAALAAAFGACTHKGDAVSRQCGLCNSSVRATSRLVYQVFLKGSPT